jgi:hypothetical protein
MIAEFKRRYRGNYTKADLLEFLKKKLEIEGYWEKVGLVWDGRLLTTNAFHLRPVC